MEKISEQNPTLEKKWQLNILRQPSPKGGHYS
jgi:hypothetical protein